MKSFLTGSHRYGSTTEESDIDLVIHISEEDARGLIAQSDNPPSEELIQHYGINGLNTVRFGILNILICTNPLHFMAWRVGTYLCEDKCDELGRPLEREEAVAIFSKLFSDNGLEESQ